MLNWPNRGFWIRRHTQQLQHNLLLSSERVLRTVESLFTRSLYQCSDDDYELPQSMSQHVIRFLTCTPSLDLDSANFCWSCCVCDAWFKILDSANLTYSVTESRAPTLSPIDYMYIIITHRVQGGECNAFRESSYLLLLESRTVL